MKPRSLSAVRILFGFVALVLTLVATSPAADPQANGPDVENVAYGPHQRNVLDLWKAKSEKPTPLVVFIHGGGFVNGDKGQVRNRPVIRQCLDAGVSFASINYRFREHAAIQDILRDAARAIQYLRAHAKEYNIDPARIAAFGGSAGAGTSLWLAFHDDLADPKATDPVLRQSSRLTAAGSLEGQASYDLRDWKQIVGDSPFARGAAEWVQFYRFASAADVDTPEADRVMRDCSMVNLITKDDVPVALACSFPDEEPKDRGAYLHHPKHSTAIADRCKQNGIDCLLLLDGSSGRAAREEQGTKVVAFLIDKLKAG
ncbi:MAG TPA: alpha/beta hydrolase [Pirellulales bacterium]|nr:alpha/beta hydrolase [Pirellulales bacterium]